MNIIIIKQIMLIPSDSFRRDFFGEYMNDFRFDIILLINKAFLLIIKKLLNNCFINRLVSNIIIPFFYYHYPLRLLKKKTEI